MFFGVYCKRMWSHVVASCAFGHSGQEVMYRLPMSGCIGCPCAAGVDVEAREQVSSGIRIRSYDQAPQGDAEERTKIHVCRRLDFNAVVVDTTGGRFHEEGGITARSRHGAS